MNRLIKLITPTIKQMELSMKIAEFQIIHIQIQEHYFSLSLSI